MILLRWLYNFIVKSLETRVLLICKFFSGFHVKYGPKRFKLDLSASTRRDVLVPTSRKDTSFDRCNKNTSSQQFSLTQIGLTLFNHTIFKLNILPKLESPQHINFKELFFKG